jgi:uncharacterized protein
MFEAPQTAHLPGNRLHLSEGPIDLIIWADGEPAAVADAYRAAERRFTGLLAELVAELPMLRAPLGAAMRHDSRSNSPPPCGEGLGVGGTPTIDVLESPPPCPSPTRREGTLKLQGPIARRMAEACRPYRDAFITPMAAVAGAVAEAVLNAMTQAAPLACAYVNNGGDIALHLTPGTSLSIGVVRSLEKAVPEGDVCIAYEMPIRGIATSGRHGRSFSLGIADAVTVLARDAPSADAAATIIANAVNIDDTAIVRRPAHDLDPDSDLGDMLVTVDVGPLAPAQIAAALEAGVSCAETLRRANLIAGALLTLAGEWRSVGAPGAFLSASNKKGGRNRSQVSNGR